MPAYPPIAGLLAQETLAIAVAIDVGRLSRTQHKLRVDDEHPSRRSSSGDEVDPRNSRHNNSHTPQPPSAENINGGADVSQVVIAQNPRDVGASVEQETTTNTSGHGRGSISRANSQVILHAEDHGAHGQAPTATSSAGTASAKTTVGVSANAAPKFSVADHTGTGRLLHSTTDTPDVCSQPTSDARPRPQQDVPGARHANTTNIPATSCTTAQQQQRGRTRVGQCLRVKFSDGVTPIGTSPAPLLAPQALGHALTTTHPTYSRQEYDRTPIEVPYDSMSREEKEAVNDEIVQFCEGEMSAKVAGSQRHTTVHWINRGQGEKVTSFVRVRLRALRADAIRQGRAGVQSGGVPLYRYTARGQTTASPGVMGTTGHSNIANNGRNGSSLSSNTTTGTRATTRRTSTLIMASSGGGGGANSSFSSARVRKASGNSELAGFLSGSNFM